MRVTPWLTDGAVGFIAKWPSERKSKPVVWEFGSGFSTLWFLSLGATVNSVEHDYAWSQKIETTATAFGLTERLELVHAERPHHETFLNREWRRPDLLLIDGRGRVKCLQANLSGLMPDGLLVLDNFERARNQYAQMLELTRDLGTIHFEQPRVVAQSGETITLEDRSLGRVGHQWITSVFFQRSERRTTMGVTLLS